MQSGTISICVRRAVIGSQAKKAIRFQTRNVSVGPTDNIFVHRSKDEFGPSTGSAKGPLASWKVSLKDNICTHDMPTSCSSRMLEAYTSPFDATVVTLLRNAGTHILGKTNCDEFGMGSTNVDSVFGPVVNPASHVGDPERVAGGSSGGAAASVAAKLCRIAIGSDTGGSVRLPAAYCGVYGLKPSYGLISRWGLVSYADSLDTIGIMASRSNDLRAVYETLAQFDDKDPTSISTDVRARADRLAQSALDKSAKRGSLKGFRIGVPQEFFAKEVHPDTLPAVRQALATLRQLGAQIVSVSLPSVKYALSAYYVLASAEASSNLARYDGIRYGHRTTETAAGLGFAQQIARTRSEAFGKEVQKRLLLGTYSLTSDLFNNYFLQAQRVRQLVRHDMDSAFCIANALNVTDEQVKADGGASQGTIDGVHALLHPSAVGVAPTLEEAKQPGLEAYTQDLLTVPASLAGLPAVSVPMGRAKDMPIGITLTTQWGCEPILWRLLEHLGP